MSKKRSDHTIARSIGAARVSAPDDDFLAIVRALAKRHAREDHAAEIARNASTHAIRAKP
jgi:hypothetical protein